MQRRKVESSGTSGLMDSGNSMLTGVDASSPSAVSGSFKDKPKNARFFRNVRNAKLVYGIVGTALFFFLASYIFPSEVKEVEMGAIHMEQQMEDYFKHKVGSSSTTTTTGQHQHQQQQQPIENGNQNQRQEEVSPNGEVSNVSHEAQESSSSSLSFSTYSWVEGEKKLKKCLKPLAERQKNGQDLGVPVLTRWLGDDIPCYVSQDVNKAEWEAKVKERYDQMRDENKKWQQQVKEHIDAHPLKLKL